MMPFRSLLAVLLAATLALSSGAAAVARGQAGPAGSIVICTGSGTVVVDVDTDGQPIKRAHVCPECLAASLDADLPLPTDAVLARLGRALDRNSHSGAAGEGARGTWFEARAPPMGVFA